MSMLLTSSRAHSLALARRELVLLAAAVSIVGIGQAALFAYIPVLIEVTRLSVLTLGIIAALGLLAIMAGAPLWGGLSDRIGRRRTLMLCLAGHAAAQLALAAVVTLAADARMGALTCAAALGFARLAYGLATAGIVPVAQAWVADGSATPARLRGFAAVSAGLSAGRLIGPLVVSAGLALGALTPPWLLAALALAATLTPALMREPPVVARAAEAGTARGPWAVLAFGYLLSTAFGQMHFVLGPLVQERLGMTSVAAGHAVGLMAALAALVMLAAQLIVVPRLARVPRRAVRIGCAALCTGAVLIAGGASLAAIAAGAIGLGVGMALLYPVSVMALSLAAGAARQGAAAGRLSAASTFGYASGAVIGGALYGAAPAAPFLAGAACGLVLLALGARLELQNVEESRATSVSGSPR